MTNHWPKQYQHIAIYAPAWVGDMVMSHVLIRQLKYEYPQAKITVVAPPATQAVAQRFAEVDQVITIAVKSGQINWSERKAVGRRLKAGNVDWVITLPVTFKSALTGWFSAANRRTGYAGEWRIGLLNDRHREPRRWNETAQQWDLPYMAQRYAKLVRAKDGAKDDALPALEQLLWPQLQVDVENKRHWWQHIHTQWQQCNDLPLPTQWIGLAPGAEFGPAKRWPMDHYAQVARHWIEQGKGVVILGSPKDQAVGDDIIESLGSNDGQTVKKRPLNLCGQTGLLDAVDVMSCLDGVVSNDSGLMHMAAALNRPQVAIFRSSTPDYTPPLNDKAVIMQATFPPGWSDQKRIKLTSVDGIDGFEDVMPDEVIAQLNRVMNDSD